jgi:hypothetical protein
VATHTGLAGFAGTRQWCLVPLPAVIGRKRFTVTRIGLKRAACPRCILTRQLFPVGGQQLFRRRAAVLVASLNDNCPFGREGGSIEQLRTASKTLSGLRLAVVSAVNHLTKKDRQ